MSFSQPIADIIKHRSSIRTYRREPISAERQDRIGQQIQGAQGPFGTNLRFQLVAAKAGDSDALSGLGTYGFIKNAPAFVIGALQPADKDLEDYGYAMERIILESTDQGLATCWLGGSFSRSKFAQKIGALDNETVPAVAAIGYATEKRSTLDRIVRWSAKSKQRRPWQQLFFAGSFHHPLTQAAAAEYSAPLEMLRLGPSASNMQPWRVIRDRDQVTFHFFLQRSKKYERNLKLMRFSDLPRVDMGIALCHFELSAKEAGLVGKWAILEPGIDGTPELASYVVSWVGE